MIEQNTYRFVWLDGSTNVGDGIHPADAFTKLGFGAGAMPGLDYYEKIDTESQAIKTGDA
jgi:hypothetical protein